MNDPLALFPSGSPSPESVMRLFRAGQSFNSSIDLYDTVRMNENFFIGRQWEGIESNGLPTPQFNILKRVVGFTVATVTTDNIKVTASPMKGTDAYIAPDQIINAEFEALMEQCDIPALIREYARNAAVDGDGCLYTWWDPEKGIRTEVVDNTRVIFGNPNDRRVQSQPYIILSRMEELRAIKRRARALGSPDWDSIHPDTEDPCATDVQKLTNGKVCVLLTLWRDEKTGHIFSYESTADCQVKAATDLGIRLYPLCWLNWDYVKDCYHGEAMITALLPNQIFINKSWAMTMLSIMKSAFPKIIYDKTRIPAWDNGVGRAIAVNGGDMNSVARIMDPAVISPQISEYINLAVSQTEKCLGASAAALGDVNPDNTSAIIALQRAAATPNELTKQNLYKSVEELFRIYLEFMGAYYGVRTVETDPPETLRGAARFGGVKCPDKVAVSFDFAVLREHPVTLKLDVGASAYYSEIAAIQTVDALLRAGKITTLQYLERIPDDYVPGRTALIRELKAQSEVTEP